MKLSTIFRTEATIKHSFALKKSTTEGLHQYQELYKNTHGIEVALKDLVEQMLVDFMAEDKTFQKSLKKSVVTGKPADAIQAYTQPETPQLDI